MDSSTEHKEHKPEKNHPEITKFIGAALLVFIACGISFYGGVAYQKKQQPSIQTAGFRGLVQDSEQGMIGGRGMRQNGVIGSVTNISENSITITDQRATKSTTLTITSDTVITDNDAIVTASDIKVADQVLIQTSASDSNIATKISINPTMPGGGPNGAINPNDDIKVN